MTLSKNLAGLIGPALVVLAIGVFLNRGLLPGMVDRLEGDYALFLIAGLLALLGGIAIVRAHNVWTGWPVVITLLGWLAIVGGIARVMFPTPIIQVAHTVITAQGVIVPIAMAVVGLVGLFLSYQGFARRA